MPPGKPCPHNSKKRCEDCQREVNRQYRYGAGKVVRDAYYDANKPQIKAYRQAWYEANKEDIWERARIRREENRQKYRDSSRRYRGMIFPPGHTEQTIVDLQGNACAICRRSFDEVKLHMDHNHTTGRVRGALCSKCNSVLGYMDDDAARLRSAAAYLESNLETNT